MTALVRNSQSSPLHEKNRIKPSEWKRSAAVSSSICVRLCHGHLQAAASFCWCTAAEGGKANARKCGEFASHYVDGSSPKVEEIISASSAADILPHAGRCFVLFLLFPPECTAVPLRWSSMCCVFFLLLWFFKNLPLFLFFFDSDAIPMASKLTRIFSKWSFNPEIASDFEAIMLGWLKPWN